MEFTNTLQVPLPPNEAWKLLLDIKSVAECIPGAELTEVVDDRTYRGKVLVRLGPIALSLVGDAKFEELDPENRRARLKTHGKDPKGRGSADAVIDFKFEQTATGSSVVIHTDLKLSGAIAQYGRAAGVVQTFSAQLIADFGECLKRKIAAAGVQNDSGSVPTRPISGFALVVKVIWSSIIRLLKRGQQKP